jgi:hypothetical protein
MKLNVHDRFWMVTDPTSLSELGDICFETSLADLVLQIKGGLELKENPTIFTAEDDARLEGRKRLLVRSVVKAVLEGGLDGSPESVRSVTLESEEGLPVFEADIRL